MQLQCQAVLPLLVRHLEEVDLGYGTRDVEQSVDAAEGSKGLIDHRLRSRRLAQVGIDDERVRSSGPDSFCRLLQVRAIAGDQSQRPEVTREADGCRLSDALAGARHDGD